MQSEDQEKRQGKGACRAKEEREDQMHLLQPLLSSQVRMHEEAYLFDGVYSSEEQPH